MEQSRGLAQARRPGRERAYDTSPMEHGNLMDGVYIAFMVIIIMVLVIDYAAGFRPPDHEAPRDVSAEHLAQDDDAA